MSRLYSAAEYEAEQQRKLLKINTIFGGLKVMKVEFKKVTETKNFACAYDKQFEKLCVLAWNSKSNDFDLDVFDCDKIKSIEIGAIDVTREAHVTGTKIGSALIGGALLGPGGALIGAMVGQQGGKKNETLTRPQFQVSTADPAMNGIAHTLTYATDVEEVTAWVTKLRGLLNDRKLSKKDAAPKATAKPKGKDNSLADEILKLATLHKEGLLSLEEYQSAKAKLLN